MERAAATTFTATEIARGLQRTKRGVLAALSGTPPTTVKLVRGNTASAWALDALPESMQAKVGTAVGKASCRNFTHLLSSPGAPWTPAVPLAEAAPTAVERAVKLQGALAPVFARMSDLSLSEAEFERFGVDAYRRAFGHSVSARHWRRLFARTVARDGGAEMWSRVEIYLDKAPARKAGLLRGLPVSQASFKQLHDVIGSITKSGSPTASKKDYLWQYIFEHHEAASGQRSNDKKGALLGFLYQHASFLGKSRKGIRLQFNRKFERWIAGGRIPAAIADGRHGNLGRPAPKLSNETENALIAKTLQSGGGLSQAWRHFRDEGLLDSSLSEHYRCEPSDKSYVPSRIRRQLRPKIAMLDDPHHGPRATKLNGAFISRDPNTFHAGDWWQADDATLPNYYYVTDANGVHLMRGQFLAMIDVRTTFLMGFVLISQRNYTAHHIRNLTTVVADQYGLPRDGFYYEGSLWKSARLLHGRKDELDWHQTEMGLRGLGLKFRHARLPRGKVIEKVFSSIQNYLESEPGYCGRDERHDKFERVQQRIRLVNNGKAHPSEFFLSEADWIGRLNVIVDKYNYERQQGKYCAGLSPREAFERFYGPEPCTRLHPSSRHLLASHKMRVRSGRNGISFRFGREQFTYKSRETGELRGQEMIAWFNVEDPSTLSVTNLKEDQASFFTVAREISVPAMNASPEILAAALAQNDAHDSYRRALYRTVSQNFSTGFAGRMFRGNLVDRKTFEAGSAMRNQTRQLKAERIDQRKRAASIDRKARRLGIAPGVMSSRGADAEAGVDQMTEAMAKLGLLAESSGEKELE